MSALCPRYVLQTVSEGAICVRNTPRTTAENQYGSYSPKAEVTSSNLVGCTILSIYIV
jgi:hypothetical protein